MVAKRCFAEAFSLRNQHLVNFDESVLLNIAFRRHTSPWLPVGFRATEKELTETIDTLERATAVLSRGQYSFLQRGGAKDLSKLATGLSRTNASATVRRVGRSES